MNGLSVIIPSKCDRNVLACLRAIRHRNPHDLSLCVVDDGLSEQGLIYYEQAAIIPGDKPFIYARNCNRGIEAAGTNDVILLNDDAILETPGGFSILQAMAETYREYGIISATTNVAGNVDQYPKGIGLRGAGVKCVAFVCVLIPRRTIDLVGLLDERFGGTLPDGRIVYGFDDNDYCRRVRNAGLKVGIFDGCYVDHGSLRSTFRGDPRAAGDIWPAAEIYRQKWGDLA